MLPATNYDLKYASIIGEGLSNTQVVNYQTEFKNSLKFLLLINFLINCSSVISETNFASEQKITQ